VDSVIEALKPWDEVYSRAEVAADVTEKVELIRACHVEHFARDAVRHTRDNSRELIELTDLLKTKLARARPEIALRVNPDQLKSDLDKISQACQLAETESLTDGRKDQTKEWCVKIAGGLIIKFSAKLPTVESLMAVAHPLYEEAIGRKAKENAGLRRSCEKYIKLIQPLTKRG
jgi:hypothetical protein